MGHWVGKQQIWREEKVAIRMTQIDSDFFLELSPSLDSLFWEDGVKLNLKPISVYSLWPCVCHNLQLQEALASQPQHYLFLGLKHRLVAKFLFSTLCSYHWTSWECEPLAGPETRPFFCGRETGGFAALHTSPGEFLRSGKNLSLTVCDPYMTDMSWHCTSQRSYFHSCQEMLCSGIYLSVKVGGPVSVTVPP